MTRIRLDVMKLELDPRNKQMVLIHARLVEAPPAEMANAPSDFLSEEGATIGGFEICGLLEPWATIGALCSCVGVFGANADPDISRADVMALCGDRGIFAGHAENKDMALSVAAWNHQVEEYIETMGGIPDMPPEVVKFIEDGYGFVASLIEQGMQREALKHMVNLSKNTFITGHLLGSGKYNHQAPNKEGFMDGPIPDVFTGAFKDGS